MASTRLVVGPRGATGATGHGIASASVNVDGDLVLTLDNAATLTPVTVPALAGALAAEAAAAISESASGQYATDASGSSGIATNAALAASASAVAAAASQSAAGTSATDAGTAKTDAEAARDLALTYRNAAQSATFAGTDLGTTDLNTVTTTGSYYQGSTGNATTARNYPVETVVCSLLVLPYYTGTNVIQVLTIASSAYGGGATRYARRYSGGSWSTWRVQGVRLDNTTGRAAWTWDPTNSREQLVYGDTGWRDVTASLINGWTATAVYVRRVGYQVMMHAEALAAAAATNANFITAPTGFAPYSGVTFRGMLHTTATPPVAYRTAGLSIPAYASGGTLYGSLAPYTTADAWPASLPGNAVGTIPYN